MKKVLIGLCAALLFVLMSMTVLADGYYFDFEENGYLYSLTFSITTPDRALNSENGIIDDSIYVTCRSYKGTRYVDVNVLPKYRESFTLKEVLEKAGIANETELVQNWQSNLNDRLVTESWITPYDPKNTVDVKVSKNTQNTTKLDFADQNPIIINGRTLLPIRAIAEYYGWEVSWNQSTKSVEIKSGDIRAKITVGYSYIPVYQGSQLSPMKTVTTDAPAIIINGRTLLPVRAVSEAMGLKVEWNSKERCVYIDNSKLTGYGKFKFGMSMEEAKAVVDGPYEMGEDGESICLEDYFKNKYKNEDASITGDVACQDIILYFDNNKLSLIYVMTESLNKQESEEFFAEMIKLFGDNYKPAEYNENGYEWYFEEGNIIVRLAVYDYENTQFNYEFNFLDKDYI